MNDFYEWTAPEQKNFRNKITQFSILFFAGVEACLEYGACWKGSEEGFEINGDTTDGRTDAPMRARQLQNSDILRNYVIGVDTSVPYYEGMKC